MTDYEEIVRLREQVASLAAALDAAKADNDQLRLIVQGVAHSPYCTPEALCDRCRAEQLAVDLEAAKDEHDQEKSHVRLLNQAIQEMVEAAAPFQSGGRFDDKLPLGSSTVVDGLSWLFTEHDRLTAKLKTAKARAESIRTKLCEVVCADVDERTAIARIVHDLSGAAEEDQREMDQARSRAEQAERDLATAKAAWQPVRELITKWRELPNTTHGKHYINACADELDALVPKE